MITIHLPTPFLAESSGLKAQILCTFRYSASNYAKVGKDFQLQDQGEFVTSKLPGMNDSEVEGQQ